MVCFLYQSFKKIIESSPVEDRTDIPKDDDKPDGDAINPDGTLKMADQIIWDHSPTSSSVPKWKININKPNEESTSKKQKTVHLPLSEKPWEIQIGHYSSMPLPSQWLWLILPWMTQAVVKHQRWKKERNDTGRSNQMEAKYIWNSAVTSH